MLSMNHGYAATNLRMNVDKTYGNEIMDNRMKDNDLQGLRRYIGCSCTTIQTRLGIALNRESKSFYRQLVDKMVLHETEHTNDLLNNVTIRVCRLGAVSNQPKESSSFPAIDFTKIVEEDWETSDLRALFLKQFLFFFFREAPEKNDYYLDKILLWQMLREDLEGKVRKAWERTFLTISTGRYNDFPKLRDDSIIHIRPHTSLSSDRKLTPQGTYTKVVSFWLNSSYIGLIYEGMK